GYPRHRGVRVWRAVDRLAGAQLLARHPSRRVQQAAPYL
ncbi:MAG: hypothetical protein AVDCRST_MAG77-3217, partial [uncultured Chloroflexi bacterium]